MASIIQGTDGDVVVSIGSDLDLNTVEWFSVRIVQGSLYIEKTKDDLFLDFDNREIHVPISKEESMRFIHYYSLPLLKMRKRVGIVPILVLIIQIVVQILRTIL